MGTESISMAIGRQCAPLLVGIKPSNLLILERGYEALLDEVLTGSGLCRCLLYTSQAKDYWFIYEEQQLRDVMGRSREARFLEQCGYPPRRTDIPAEMSSEKGLGNELPQRNGIPAETLSKRNSGSESPQRNGIPIEISPERDFGNELVQRNGTPVEMSPERGFENELPRTNDGMGKIMPEKELAAAMSQTEDRPDDLPQVLETLRLRFTAYKREEAEFPHEMGVLLGYPLNDVLGFIRHKGRDFKLSGYWKVYDNVTYADWMFRLYENAKTLVLQMCRQGFLIPEICAVCRMETAALLQG